MGPPFQKSGPSLYDHPAAAHSLETQREPPPPLRPRPPRRLLSSNQRRFRIQVRDLQLGIQNFRSSMPHNHL